MGYFPNNTSFDYFVEKLCGNCLWFNWDEYTCPILEVHAQYNYSQHDNPEEKQALNFFLDTEIAERKAFLNKDYDKPIKEQK